MDAAIVHQELQAGLAQLKTRLERELEHLHTGLNSLNACGDDAERWAHELYQRLIERRRTTLALFFSPL
ncbi:MAG: hypothetical protein AB1450_14995 [Pseudomonadota bacterium]